MCMRFVSRRPRQFWLFDARIWNMTQMRAYFFLGLSLIMIIFADKSITKRL